MNVSVKMEYDEWYDTYKPIKNTIGQPDDIWLNIIFETFGAEQEFVMDNIANNTVWTMVDGDDGVWIINGFHFVNRIGYFVTEKPYDPNIHYNILDMEYGQ